MVNRMKKKKYELARRIVSAVRNESRVNWGKYDRVKGVSRVKKKKVE